MVFSLFADQIIYLSTAAIYCLGLLRFTFLSLRQSHTLGIMTGEPQLRDHNEDWHQSPIKDKGYPRSLLGQAGSACGTFFTESGDIFHRIDYLFVR